MVNFFVFLKQIFFFCFVVAIFDNVHNVQLEIISKLQFHGHHSYFRKDFQMLLAVKKGEIYPPHRALGQI